MSKNNDAADARWWVVALSEEVQAGKPFAVMCDGVEYVLFREADGVVRALLDQCAHRRAPLSLGHVTAEGWIECPYHGWRYDGISGSCRAIPNLSAQERVPEAYRVPAFAAVEHHGFIQLCPQGPKGDMKRLNTLALDAKPLAWQGGKLIAYPQEALVDLLLDAPGAVLEIPGVTVVDGHRYGDPVTSADEVVVTHAAYWTPRGKAVQRVIADYPLAVRVAVDAQGHIARVDVHTDAGEALASAYLALTPVKPTLTRVHWRGSGVQHGTHALEIGVRGQLQPEAVNAAFAYPSRLRRELAAAKQPSAA